MDAREGDEGAKESRRDEGEGHQGKKKKIFRDWEGRKDGDSQMLCLSCELGIS